MTTPLTRRGLIGATGALAGLGLTGTATAALPPPQREDRRHGLYEEQPLAWPGYRGVDNFRIPALEVAPNGDLLAGFDKRPEHGDSPAPNSIWLRRSRDGGRTWEEPTVVRAGEETGDPDTQTGYSDPSFVVDREAGLVFCFYVFSKNAGVWDSDYGNDDADRDIISAALSVSSDSGATWEHRSLTTVVKPEDCRAMFASSGAGIQVRNGSYAGRLIQQYAGWFRRSDGGEDVQAYSVYSDDHGETWTMGTPVGESLDENKVVELSDATLMMNSREHVRTGSRWVARSDDGGRTWHDLHRDPTLVDPGNNAHIARAYPDAPRGSERAKWLLFSHADNPPDERINGTIELSIDDGATWVRKRVFQPGTCQYSVIVPISLREFGLLYEAAEETITFARLDREWILHR